jgi:inner membrane protein
MASVFSHGVVALGIGACFFGASAPKRVYWAGALCSAIPDLDVIGFRFGIRYGDFWGHRGFTHSLVFAAIVAAAALAAAICSGAPAVSRASLYFYFFLTSASHGVLDAMTNGGLGVAFFSPFDTQRYFLPWRPIVVSPIGVGRFFSDHGLAVLRSELLWIWLPTLLVIGVAVSLHRKQARQASGLQQS